MSSEMGLIAMLTSFRWRKAVPDAPLGEVRLGSPESLARGMLIKGLPVNPGELPASPHIWAQVAPNPKTPGLRRARVASGRSERPSSGVSCDQGKPEAQARAGEQSYEPIVPMKVENRRAPARGGHGIHWREVAATLTAVPAGASPAGGERPDATVVISGNAKGDRHVESPDVNVSGAGETRSDPPKEASESTGRSKSEPVKPRNSWIPPEADGGNIESAEPFPSLGEGHCRR